MPFDQMIYIEHDVILHNLSKKDFCCNSKDWINLGRDAIDVNDQRDSIQRTMAFHQHRGIACKPLFTVGKERPESAEAVSRIFNCT